MADAHGSGPCGLITRGSSSLPVSTHAPRNRRSVSANRCAALIGRRAPRSLALLRALLLDLLDELVLQLAPPRLEPVELILREDALQLALLPPPDLLHGAHLREHAVGALEDRVHLL